MMPLGGSPADKSKRPETSDKKSSKRKRDFFGDIVRGEEKESLITGYRQEIDGLLIYFRHVLAERVVLDYAGCRSIDSAIACLLEESCLPFSKLVEEIFEKLKSRDGVTLASVQSTVLSVGQRSTYGIGNDSTDVLEDDSEPCLWCWECRELKSLPRAQRGILNIRRICRRKIHERITALLAMISALSKPEDHPNYKLDLRKASQKIDKVLNELQIRALVESLLQKNDAEMAEKEAKLQEKELLKASEKNMQKAEQEKKRLDRALQKEKLQSERELKRLQDEAEKEERRREKEKAELEKQLKRKRDEAERDQRRRQKEEAEAKRQLAIKKQASIMERFLKRKINNPDIQNDRSPGKASELDSSPKSRETVSPVTLSMDDALSQKDGTDTHDLLRTHLVAWHKFSQSIHRNKSHWGVRRKPKVALFTELKLQRSSSGAGPSGKVTPNRRRDSFEVKDGNDWSLEKLVDGWEETLVNERSCHNSNDTPLPNMRLCNKTKKLLQFDRSHRPAYYGTLSSKSGVVGPRKPFKKDPNLDYDIESDEEWEEDDPGESLSDCDEDDEEENLQDEDAGGSEDGFVVPDGYLSENEGVQVDGMVSNSADDEVRSSRSCMQDVESDEFIAFRRRQKCLYDLTERALRRDRPLIILNLMHEKAALMMAEDLSGTHKLEQVCLQALKMRSFSVESIEISAERFSLTKDKMSPQLENSTSSPVSVPAAVVLDLDLHEVVSSIQSCSHGINKIIESLQKKFPTVPKSQLRSKVREVSDIMDNRWQVKKEVLDKLGLSVSPEKSMGRTNGIATFFLKRCLPPACESMDATGSSPQSCYKPVIHPHGPECMESRL